MKIETTSTQKVSAKQLAESLAKASPEEFAQFWFDFSEYCEKNKVDVDKFGEAMYPNFGGKRKAPFVRIFKVMQYLEILNDKS